MDWIKVNRGLGLKVTGGRAGRWEEGGGANQQSELCVGELANPAERPTADRAQMSPGRRQSYPASRYLLFFVGGLEERGPYGRSSPCPSGI